MLFYSLYWRYSLRWNCPSWYWWSEDCGWANERTITCQFWDTSSLPYHCRQNSSTRGGDVRIFNLKLEAWNLGWRTSWLAINLVTFYLDFFNSQQHKAHFAFLNAIGIIADKKQKPVKLERVPQNSIWLMSERKVTPPWHLNHQMYYRKLQHMALYWVWNFGATFLLELNNLVSA